MPNDRKHRDGYSTDPTNAFIVPPSRWKFNVGDQVIHVRTQRLYQIVAHAYDEANVQPVYVYRCPFGLSPAERATWTRSKLDFEDGRFAPAYTAGAVDKIT
jgi:hypothetical protein